MRQLDIALEGREVGTVPMQVDVVEEAGTPAGVDHLLEPVKTLARARAGGDGGEGFLDREGVDVLLVPGRRLTR